MPTQNIFDLVDTWASGGGPYTSIKMNATDNDVGSASLLMDLQVGGSSRFRVKKDGGIVSPGYADSSFVNGDILISGASTLWVGYGVKTGGAGYFGLSSTAASNSTPDTWITRRAAANLRFGAADAAAPVAQTLSVQSVVAGTTNTAGTNLTITGSQGTGTGAGGSIVFQVAPAGSTGTAQNALVTALTIAGTGQVTFSQTANFSNDLVFAGGTQLTFSGNGAIRWLSAGVLRLSNAAVTDFDRLQFGGTTSSFPALKRSSTTLQVRLADDSAFATVQGKLRADVNAVAETPTATHTITITDAAGTAYKVLCVAA